MKGTVMRGKYQRLGRGHSILLPWMKCLNLGPAETVCHLCCQAVWSSSRDLGMLEEKEMVVVGL